MERTYSTGLADNIKYFIGKEIEHTRFYNENTLFVVDPQPIEDIIRHADKHKINHIFLGANHSDYSQEQAQDLLNHGYKVTIDCDYTKAEYIWLDHDNFCLIVRYPLPEKLINNKTYVKFYTEDLNRKGIYVIPSELLKEDQYFTDNSEYGNDIIINEGK